MSGCAVVGFTTIGAVVVADASLGGVNAVGRKRTGCWLRSCHACDTVVAGTPLCWAIDKLGATLAGIAIGGKLSAVVVLAVGLWAG